MPPEKLENCPSTDHEAREDCQDIQQTFEGHFGVPKAKEVMRLLNVANEENDLPETL